MKKLLVSLLVLLLVMPSACASQEQSQTLHYPFGVTPEHTINDVRRVLGEHLETTFDEDIYEFLANWNSYSATSDVKLFNKALKRVTIYFSPKIPKETPIPERPTEWSSISFVFDKSKNPISDFFDIRNEMVALYGDPTSEGVYSNVTTFEGTKSVAYNMPTTWRAVKNTLRDAEQYIAESHWDNVTLYYHHIASAPDASLLVASFNRELAPTD